ncbi:MAG: glucosaminidase domain-containing protein [Telluria sp.]
MQGPRWINAVLMTLALVVQAEVHAQLATKDWGCYDAQPDHPSAVEKTSFVEQIATLAINAEEKYGVPASALAAMAIVESGYGWTRTAQNARNLFGWKFYSLKAAGGRKAYVLACQPKEDDNNRYVVFATNADAFDFVAMKLATLPAYASRTKAYQTARAKGVTAAEAAKAWVAGIANPYNWHPKQYTRTITRVMNNALAPSNMVSEELNLYRLSDGVVAFAGKTTSTATAADTDAIIAGIKAKLAALGSSVSHCDPPVMNFARWNGFPVQLCGYQDGGVSVRTYILNASPEQRARWIVNACLDIQAASTKTCADKLFDSIKTASSGGVFPVAGFIPEPASAAGG